MQQDSNGKVNRLRKRVTLERVLSLIITLCAVVTTGLFARRELNDGSVVARRQSQQVTRTATVEPASPRQRQDSVYFEDWLAETKSGIRVGPTDAPVQIIEFMDLECPFCARFAAALDSLRADYPAAVAVTIHHFPLSNHAFARPGAVAAECAHAQGGFEEFMSAVFTQQDLLGDKGWREYASEAGIKDLRQFDRCRKQHATFARIEHGIELGRRWRIRGTPTVLINGWKLAAPPRLPDLRARVQSILSERAPKPPAQSSSN